MSAAVLLALALALALAPTPAPAPAPEYYLTEAEELKSVKGDWRSCGGCKWDNDTEDADGTDLAKHDFVEKKEQMFLDKMASLKRQLQQLQEVTLQEHQDRMKNLDQQYKGSEMQNFSSSWKLRV